MRLATICARAGSKRLPGKNTRMLPNGLTLLDHTLWYAQISQCFDDIVLSTDITNARMYERGGIIVVDRPPELASDEAGKVPAIRHAMLAAEYSRGCTFDQIVDLDVTAPLRNLDDIRGFCAKLDSMEHGNLVSVCKARRSPAFNMVESCKYGGYSLVKRMHSIVRSQDAPECYELNASLYGWKRNALLNGGDAVINWDTDIYEMPKSRSWDIDDQDDLDIVEFLMSKQRESVAA